LNFPLLTIPGSLTKIQIFYHHKNTVADLCKNQTEYCQKLYRYLGENLAWIKSQVLANPPSDIYWRQVNLVNFGIFELQEEICLYLQTFMQLTGINDGNN
jgi:hypothetical protein